MTRAKFLFVLITVGLLAAACGPRSPFPETPVATPTVAWSDTPLPVATVTETAIPEMSPTPEVPTSTAGIPVTGADLANTKWRLISFGEQGAENPVLEDTEVMLEFEPNSQAGGFGGCNTFSAQYGMQDGTISFQEIISTEIACLAEGVMEQEQRYFQALRGARSFELAGDELVIRYGAEGEVLNFVRIENHSSPTPVSGLLCSTVSEGSIDGWHLCRSQNYGFEFQYPPDAELIDHTASSARINLSFPSHVNLTEKYLTISAIEESGVCSSPLAEGRPIGSFEREPVQINGLEFVKETGQEAATGSVYNWEAYSIRRNSQCISFSFVLRSFRPEFQSTPPPRFDLQEESKVFSEIMSTFLWLETQRIEFRAGETSATLTGHLEHSGSDQYVLRALQGQTMMIDLSFTEGQAILAVWGEDGTVLLSDQAEASSFSSVLPSTQDYYILVKGRPAGSTTYNMTVAIPPLS